jgi:hypothetical protein
VSLENNFDFPVFVTVSIEGDIAEFVSVSENDFVLTPREKKTLTYYFVTQPDTAKGNYTGSTRIMFKRSYFD